MALSGASCTECIKTAATAPRAHLCLCECTPASSRGRGCGEASQNQRGCTFAKWFTVGRSLVPPLPKPPPPLFSLSASLSHLSGKSPIRGGIPVIWQVPCRPIGRHARQVEVARPRMHGIPCETRSPMCLMKRAGHDPGCWAMCLPAPQAQIRPRLEWCLQPVGPPEPWVCPPIKVEPRGDRSPAPNTRRQCIVLPVCSRSAL